MNLICRPGHCILLQVFLFRRCGHNMPKPAAKLAIFFHPAKNFESRPQKISENFISLLAHSEKTSYLCTRMTALAPPLLRPDFRAVSRLLAPLPTVIASFLPTFAVVAQLVEHQLPKLRVASSSLVYRSQHKPLKISPLAPIFRGFFLYTYHKMDQCKKSVVKICPTASQPSGPPPKKILRSYRPC